MRRTSLSLTGVLLAAFSFGSDTPREYDATVEVDDLQGTWRLAEIESNGRKTELPFQLVRTYHGGTYTSKFDDGLIREGNYRIDRARTPHHLDQLPSISTPIRLIRCIYQINGDTLRFAECNEDPLRQPKHFDDENLLIWTFKRAK
jgi:uncharacterized protein (TIGR03067 family)